MRSANLAIRAQARLALLLVATLALPTACSAPPAPPQPPVNIASGDTCAVCGMYIHGFPGPRGEAYLRDGEKPLKFGSTRDFFAYVTRADVRGRLGALYVQDTARIDWEHPSDAAASFVDARRAWYVAFQPLHGAMGPTLASFATEADARAFLRAHGGALLRFDQITPKLISDLDYRCPGARSPLRSLAPDCMRKE